MADINTDESTKTRRKRRGGTRRKTGCSTCKARHIRCDELKPVCSTCKRLGLECIPSEFITHSTWAPPSGTASGRVSRHSRTVAQDVERPIFVGRVENTVLRARSSIEASNPALTPNGSNGLASPSELLTLTDENVYLLTTYRTGLATWMDLFDFNNTYQNDVTRVGMTCPLLLRCICAFAAKHLSHQTSGALWEPIASRYYVEALNLLIKEIDRVEVPTANSLTAAILLSSYEIMAALSAPHRSHYQGALDLIRARKVSASSEGLDGKNVRVYVRHEVVVALVNEMPLQLDLDDWKMPPLDGSMQEDQLAMHVIYLAGKAINLVFGDEETADRTDLLDELKAWYEAAPSTLHGTKYGDVNEEGLQKVFFAVPAAAAAMLWYHLTCILLYTDHCQESDANTVMTLEHIQAILSIGISDLPDCVRCFAIMPIYIAGKHSPDISMAFRSWSLLIDIERELGYGTEAMVQSLKDMTRKKMMSS